MQKNNRKILENQTVTREGKWRLRAVNPSANVCVRWNILCLAESKWGKPASYPSPGAWFWLFPINGKSVISRIVNEKITLMSLEMARSYLLGGLLIYLQFVFKCVGLRFWGELVACKRRTNSKPLNHRTRKMTRIHESQIYLHEVIQR